MYLLYSVLTLAVFAAVSPYFLYQAIRYKKYIGSLRQRLCFLPITFNLDAVKEIGKGHLFSQSSVLGLSVPYRSPCPASGPFQYPFRRSARAGRAP